MRRMTTFGRGLALLLVIHPRRRARCRLDRHRLPPWSWLAMSLRLMGGVEPSRKSGSPAGPAKPHEVDAAKRRVELKTHPGLGAPRRFTHATREKEGRPKPPRPQPP
jgi:hypothetical protein